MKIIFKGGMASQAEKVTWTEMVKKMVPTLLELAPADSGRQDARSRILGPAFFLPSLHLYLQKPKAVASRMASELGRT